MNELSKENNTSNKFSPRTVQGGGEMSANTEHQEVSSVSSQYGTHQPGLEYSLQRQRELYPHMVQSHIHSTCFILEYLKSKKSFWIFFIGLLTQVRSFFCVCNRNG